jgi:hypothetical protein
MLATRVRGQPDDEHVHFKSACVARALQMFVNFCIPERSFVFAYHITRLKQPLP